MLKLRGNANVIDLSSLPCSVMTVPMNISDPWISTFLSQMVYDQNGASLPALLNPSLIEVSSKNAGPAYPANQCWQNAAKYAPM